MRARPKARMLTLVFLQLDDARTECRSISVAILPEPHLVGHTGCGEYHGVSASVRGNPNPGNARKRAITRHKSPDSCGTQVDMTPGVKMAWRPLVCFVERSLANPFVNDAQWMR